MTDPRNQTTNASSRSTRIKACELAAQSDQTSKATAADLRSEVERLAKINGDNWDRWTPRERMEARYRTIAAKNAALAAEGEERRAG